MKTSKRKTPQLLAPAGSMTALRAAIQGGCNAVYLGLKAFNMRQGGAANFTPADLKRAAALCHDNGVSLHLTLNTILFQPELPKMEALLDKVHGDVDAVICWDPAVIEACANRHIPIHISTQASVANLAAARLYKSLGANRIVLARECTLSEIRRLAAASGLEIEVFVHGAQCVSVSGRCFLSQDAFGKSGNRGECLQNCRRPYRIQCADGGQEYEVESHTLLSAKDLCTIPFLGDILATGVAALKIEGRNRPPDYVRAVTSAYREAIDAWAAGALTEALKASLVDRCRQVFNRGFSNGFYGGRPIADFTTKEGNEATMRKELVGKVLNVYGKRGIVQAWLRNSPLSFGDTILIMGPTTGVVQATVTELRTEDNPSLSPSLTATFPFPHKVRRNDAIYKLIPR